MKSRKIAAMIAVILMIAVMLLLVLQPSGVASAGISRGIAVPLETSYHLVLFVTIGIWAGWLGREAMVLLPFTSLLAIAAGLSAQGGVLFFGNWHHVALVCCLQGYALIAGIMRRRSFLLAQVMLGSMCYWVGTYCVGQLPEQMPAMYFTVGMMVCAMLAMAIGVSLGVAIAMVRGTMNDARTAHAAPLAPRR